MDGFWLYVRFLPSGNLSCQSKKKKKKKKRDGRAGRKNDRDRNHKPQTVGKQISPALCSTRTNAQCPVWALFASPLEIRQEHRSVAFDPGRSRRQKC